MSYDSVVLVSTIGVATKSPSLWWLAWLQIVITCIFEKIIFKTMTYYFVLITMYLFSFISTFLQTSIIIKNIEDYMDMNCLSELSFFPFHTNLKSDINIDHKSMPLSIKLNNETCEDFDRVYESKYISVTSVLRRTKSKENARRLADWKEREVDELGEERFNKMVKKTLSSGSSLHEVVYNCLMRCEHLQMF